jgi:hypothetical protein
MKQSLNKFSFIFSVVTMFVWSAKGQNMRPVTLANQSGSIIIGITGGLSSPFGNYTKTDYSDPKSGFAGAGTNIGITGTWFLNKNFGISALVSYHQYSFKGLHNLGTGFEKDFFVDSTSALTNGNNHSINIFVGPYYSLPLSAKFSVDFRVLAGISDATLAGWDIINTDGGITHTAITQKPANAVAFGGQAGIGFRYNITNHWAVMLNGDYFYSKPNFSITNEERNANTGRKISSYNEPIACINTNLTFAYVLRNKK